MTSHWKTLVAMTLGVLAIGGAALPRSRPLLVWNASASMPLGFYRVRSVGALKVGDIVVVRPPETLATFLHTRGYLPRGVPLLKPVAALPGQRICRHGAGVAIDGRHVADALPHDRRGRPLPRWRGCVTLRHDQMFLLNPARRDSLDGRYFGALPVGAIAGRATPLWIEHAPS